MRKIATAALLGMTVSTTLLAAAAPAAAMNQDVSVQKYYSLHGKDRWHGGWRDRRFAWGYRNYDGWRHGGGDAAAALIFGLAAGAVVGSALVADADPATSHARACSSLYESYNPANDTFLGLDGFRHRCTAF